LLLSIGATSPSYAGLFDDWTDNQLCEWMDQSSPPVIIASLVNKRKIICSEGIAKKWGEASNTLDGSYSFTLSRSKPSEGSKDLGRGVLEILDGKISVAKESRWLNTSSPRYYDTFEGLINKEGNIIASFEVNALYGKGSPRLVGFSGSMDELQIKGKFDDDYEMIIKIKPFKPLEPVKKASEASSAFDDSLTLDNLTIPDNWQLVKDKKAFEKARLILKRLIPKMDGLDQNACLSMVKNWRNSMKLLTSGAGKKQKDESSAYGSNNSAIGTDIQDCLDKLIYTTQNYTGTPNYMKEILLHWAKTDAVFIPNGVQNDILDDYIYMAVQSWSSLGSYYGTFYDEFNYSDANRKIVDAYIKDKLLNINTRNLINVGKTCDPDNLERTVEGQFSTDPRNGIDNDSCGSSVWKTIPAQLLVGLRLNDKALFKKGIENTKYQLSFFDDTGIFITWAIKGSSAYKYSSHVPVMLGGLTEIYASVGYDFMEHKLRNGLSVKQLMDRQYELFDDPHQLDSWVKRYPHDYKGTPNSVYLQSSVEQIRNDAGLNLFAFVRNLPRYIDTYRADIGSSQEFDKKLGKQSHDVKQKVAAMSSGSFQPLDPYLVYISHITEPEVSSSETTKTTETTKVATSDSDPTVSKVIEVIHGDTFIVDIAEPHELAGSNIKLIIRDANTPDASKSCSRQMELGIKVKDIVTQKLVDASSIKLKNFRKTNTAVIAQVIVDGKDLGEELIAKGYASNEYGHWKAYFCSALQAMAAGDSNWKYGTVDGDKAIFWYERAIFLDPDRDQKLVTYDLSMIYMMNGDTKKSIDYLKQSANLGFMQAEEDLGAAYMNGNGVSKNLAQAKKWLKKAHENGSDSAEGICGCKF
jgi:endonuclease YncB( thermonuclease family)